MDVSVVRGEGKLLCEALDVFTEVFWLRKCIKSFGERHAILRLTLSLPVFLIIRCYYTCGRFKVKRLKRQSVYQREKKLKERGFYCCFMSHKFA